MNETPESVIARIKADAVGQAYLPKSALGGRDVFDVQKLILESIKRRRDVALSTSADRDGINVVWRPRTADEMEE